MKTWFYVLIYLLYPATALFSQETDRFGRIIPQVVRKSEQVKEETFSSKTELTPDVPEQALWKRVLYRELNLQVKENAPLYYPVRPLNGKQNLFAVLFENILEGNTPIYQYVDGYELYDEEHCLQVKDLLDELGIYYEMDETKPGTTGFIVEKDAYPAGRVTHYYIKERWFVHPVRAVLIKEIEAICPLITGMSENGTYRSPLFWVKYEDISSVLKKRKIMTSDLNNSWHYTMDEFFSRGLYNAPVVKTENLMNKTLRELYPDPDSLKMAQDEIEKQLQSFKKSLSWSPDSTEADKQQIKKERITAPGLSSKPVKAEPQTTPVRSVRRR
ncbi:MAG: gliding motility protein GldN [Tannerellaceae bacterium]|nr:gliding motility protein GldN [Tannerellaceae bacterium]